MNANSQAHDKPRLTFPWDVLSALATLAAAGVAFALGSNYPSVRAIACLFALATIVLIAHWVSGLVHWPKRWLTHRPRLFASLLVTLLASVILALAPPFKGYCCRRPPTLEPTPPPTTIPTPVTPTPSLSPTPSPSPTPRPPTPDSTPSPSPTPILSVYDAFDDGCISENTWSPLDFSESTPMPTPIIRDGCYDFGPPDNQRDLYEAGSSLVLPPIEHASGGLLSYWPRCQPREIEVTVSSYSFVGTSHAWLGLVVPNPEAGGPPIGVWISSRNVVGTTYTKVISTRAWVGSLQTDTARVIAEQLPQYTDVFLSLSFTGESAIVSVRAGDVEIHESIPASGFPAYFSLAYSVVAGSELSFRIEEVRVLPVAPMSWCFLPTVTPLP